MASNEMRRLVIAGGGTAGWLAAAALAQQFRGILEIVLVESDEIGTIGVGESTIPPIRTLHRLIRIDEQEFMRATAASFKLGISFENWKRPGDRYIHSFGFNGKSTWACEFHHFWLHSLTRGIQSELGDYCLEMQAARGRQVRDVAGVGHQLRLSSRCRRIREVPAPLFRRTWRKANRRQDPTGQAASRDRLHRRTRPRIRPGRRRRFLHRLHRLPRPADRADAARRIRGLVSLAAL